MPIEPAEFLIHASIPKIVMMLWPRSDMDRRVSLELNRWLSDDGENWLKEIYEIKEIVSCLKIPCLMKMDSLNWPFSREIGLWRHVRKVYLTGVCPCIDQKKEVKGAMDEDRPILSRKTLKLIRKEDQKVRLHVHDDSFRSGIQGKNEDLFFICNALVYDLYSKHFVECIFFVASLSYK